jgi:two-component system sensor histidine kinase PrrB
VKLATRTGLASLVASTLAVIVLANVAANEFERVLRTRVDEQLRARADSSAAILVAVGDRLAVSELNGVIESARIATPSGVVAVGEQPTEALPAVGPIGVRTVDLGAEQWRLLAVEVLDVPIPGDRAVVEFAEPLGAVEQRVRDVRRRMFATGLFAAIGAGLVGWAFGRRAVRPLTRLQRDAAVLAPDAGRPLAVGSRYGSPEVDEVAAALNASLSELGAAIARRESALAAARNFAGSATHELRTPLQSAMTNLDVALARASHPELVDARAELGRMADSLHAIQVLAEADLARAEWFEDVGVDALLDVLDEVVMRAGSGSDVRVSVVASDRATMRIWPEGVRLAVDNLIRNALRHARRDGDGDLRIDVVVDPDTSTIVVDDDGVGVAESDRVRLVAPFERGGSGGDGSGLGLAIVDRVCAAHGGRVTLGASPSGGTRAVMTLAGP